ncbi:MAG: alpha-L-fucosidase [Verrucomicrobiota bacterium]
MRSTFTTSETSSKRWFKKAKFGMFIHWGLYSLRSSVGAEWAIYREQIPKETYKTYQKKFNPDRYDPELWIDLAKRAGMKYVVLTTKHHDGFCLFDSAFTNWKSTRSPFGRDVVKDIAEICRRKGLRFGMYYSIWDLWHPGLSGGIAHSLGAEGELQQNRDQWVPSRDGINYLHSQVEELLTNYGTVDIFWFDVKRAPCAAYEGDRLIQRIRELQPDILINDRLTIGDSDTPIDIITPENKIPREGIRSADGTPLRWESCMCYNQNWGYVRDDRSYKGPEMVLQQLAEITSKGGNFLLNVGPNARGEFPEPYYRQMLEHVGSWIERNGSSIFDTNPPSIKLSPDCSWENFFCENFRWKVAYSQKGANYLYVHIIEYPDNLRIVVPAFEDYQISRAYILDDGSEVPFERQSYLGLKPKECTLILPREPDLSGLTTVVLELESIKN